jgi:hypothetical protein
MATRHEPGSKIGSCRSTRAITFVPSIQPRGKTMFQEAGFRFQEAMKTRLYHLFPISGPPSHLCQHSRLLHWTLPTRSLNTRFACRARLLSANQHPTQNQGASTQHEDSRHSSAHCLLLDRSPCKPISRVLWPAGHADSWKRRHHHPGGLWRYMRAAQHCPVLCQLVWQHQSRWHNVCA